MIHLKTINSKNLILLIIFMILLGKSINLEAIPVFDLYYGKSLEELLTGNNSKSLKVIYPNGGEVWKKGEDRLIQWEPADDQKGVAIDILLFKSGQNTIRRTITAQTPNDGKYYFIVPRNFNQTDWNLKIEISSIDKRERDQSDGYFHIKQVSGIAVETQDLTIGFFIGVLQSIWGIYQSAKSFYDNNISKSLSEQEVKFRAIIDEINDVYLRGIANDAWTAIDYFSFATSIDPKSDDYDANIRQQLSIAVFSGLKARSAIKKEINDPNRSPKYAIKLAELHTLLTPVLAISGEKLAWSYSKIKTDILDSAFITNFNLLGSAATNHNCLPIYNSLGGKLFRAYESEDINANDYERLRVIIWNSQELIKEAIDADCDYVYRIQFDVSDENGYIVKYNQCLARSDIGLISEDSDLTKEWQQLWILIQQNKDILR